MKGLLFILVAAGCLSGCGLKGPLYLPAAKREPPQPSAIVTPDPSRPTPPEAAPAPK